MYVSDSGARPGEQHLAAGDGAVLRWALRVALAVVAGVVCIIWMATLAQADTGSTSGQPDSSNPSVTAFASQTAHVPDPVATEPSPDRGGLKQIAVAAGGSQAPAVAPWVAPENASTATPVVAAVQSPVAESTTRTSTRRTSTQSPRSTGVDRPTAVKTSLEKPHVAAKPHAVTKPHVAGKPHVVPKAHAVPKPHVVAKPHAARKPHAGRPAPRLRHRMPVVVAGGAASVAGPGSDSGVPTATGADPVPVVDPVVSVDPVPVVDPVVSVDPVPVVDPVVSVDPVPVVDPVVSVDPVPVVDPVVSVDPVPVVDPVVSVDPVPVVDPVVSVDPVPVVDPVVSVDPIPRWLIRWLIRSDPAPVLASPLIVGTQAAPAPGLELPTVPAGADPATSGSAAVSSAASTTRATPATVGVAAVSAATVQTGSCVAAVSGSVSDSSIHRVSAQTPAPRPDSAEAVGIGLHGFSSDHGGSDGVSKVGASGVASGGVSTLTLFGLLNSTTHDQAAPAADCTMATTSGKSRLLSRQPGFAPD